MSSPNQPPGFSGENDANMQQSQNPFAASPPNFSANGQPQGPIGQPQFGPQAFPQNYPQMAPQPKKSGGCFKWAAIIIGAFIALIVLGTIFAVVASQGGSNKSSSAQSGASQSNQAAEETGNDQQGSDGKDSNTELTLGSTFTGREGLEVGVNSFQIVEVEFLGPRACAEVTYVNTGDKQVDFQGYWDWTIQNPSGVISDPTYSGKNDLEHGKLAPGGTISGNVCFENSEPGEYLLVYKPKLELFSTDEASWRVGI
ncbi:DUF4352 domain-containing protein [Corynebacterium freiburgense]|uniref:DUF4352 domain-containing protein n=1 Tax=Corynebacterium freiburgense TaxID=556548 RepID=UPI0004148F9D|nr:DUF4352 domain-containing protein [Corynebacterium freiburgense]WJZ03379.1 Telomeric repeat-binding factor 2 [Corynebacterium freiburgense]